MSTGNLRKENIPSFEAGANLNTPSFVVWDAVKNE